MAVEQKHLARYFRLMNVLDYWPGKSGKGDAFPKGGVPDKLRRMVARYPVVLFAGWGVAKRFKFTCQDYLTWCPYGGGKRVAAVLPHPSGVNRWYNDPVCRSEAEMFLRGIVFMADLERKHNIK